MTYTLKSLFACASTVSMGLPDGSYIPCRPCRPFGMWGLKLRIKEAWEVLTDKVDTVRWPGGQ